MNLDDMFGLGQPRWLLGQDNEFTGIQTFQNTGLHILDTDDSHDLIVSPGSDLTADRTLSLVTGDANRVVTLSGDPTLADWFDQAVKAASSPTFANLTLSTGALTITGGALALQQATTISTTAGILTLAPATTVDVQSAAATGVVFRVNTQAGDRWLSFAPDTTIAGGGSPTFNIAQDSRTINSTGADPTTTDKLTMWQFRAVALTGTNPNQVFTEATTLVITGSPTASGNASITTAYAILVDSGLSRFDEQVLVGFTLAGANVTGASVMSSGGIAFTDVLNAWIDDATHGTGTVQHFIGNETIDTTASSREVKDSIMPVNGSARHHLDVLGGLLREYDYKNGTGHFVGMIAEDVREVLPQYVVGRDTLSLRYQYMVGPLVWGYGNHEARIAELEEELRALKAK